MDKGTGVLILWILLNVPLFLFIGKIIFNSFGGFLNALSYFFRSRRMAYAADDQLDDMGAKFKGSFFVVMCGCCTYCEYLLFKKFAGE